MAVPFLNSITLNKNEVQDFKVYNIGTGNPTLSSGGDIGYFWTDTTGSKVLKWWDGSAVRTILDSASTTIVAADLSGGSAGSLPYQQGASDTTFLGIGTAGQVLKVNSGATAPEWTAQSNLSVGTATFLAGGTAGDIPVQSAAGTTGFLNIGANGRILTSNGSTPVWSATIPSSAVSGLAASATTDTTNASNISSGTLSLGRLSLANGQFYVGDASNNPAATAKTSIPLSGFGAATADVSMGTYKITNLGTPLSTDPDSTAATKGYVDSVAQGLDVKASCVVASTTNITLASPGSITIDGVSSATFTSGVTRILVKDQSAQAENGIYIWNGTGSAMTRSLDANTWDELVGAFTFIETGTANADSGWVCNVNAGGTLGTTAVTWTKFSQAGSYTAGNGMVLSGGVFHFAQSSAYTAGQIPFCSNSPTANSIGFSSNLFWDNSNNRLGIGTATVDGKVHIYGDTYANSQLRIQRNGAVNGTFSIGVAGTNNSLYIQDEVNATARLIIDGSGNLGLGAVPVAADGAAKTFQVGGRTVIQSTVGTQTLFSNNAYYDGTWKRIVEGYSNAIRFNGLGSSGANAGAITFSIAASGSAGSTITNWDSSDIRMVLDASGNLLVGTTTATSKFVVSSSGDTLATIIGGAANAKGISFYDASTNGCQIYSVSSDIRFFTTASGSSTERARIDSSGNLGIGVVPSALAGFGSTIRQKGNGAAGGFFTENSTSASWFGIYSGTGLSDSASVIYPSGGSLRFATTTSVGVGGYDPKMTLDSSGNLGLGVTPSAWSGGRAIDVGTSGAFYGDGLTYDWRVGATMNAYRKVAFNNWYYKATGQPAGRYDVASGGSTGVVHTWQTAASGTADALISWTTAMTLDASGNLLVGTASNLITSTVRLHIEGSQGIVSKSTGGFAYYPLVLWNTATSGDNVFAAFGTEASYTARFSLTYNRTANALSINATEAAGGISLTTGSSVERLRIKSTGQLNFVGQASDPAGAAGDVVYNSTSNRLKYHNGTAWVDSGTRKVSVVGGAGTGTYIDATHNFNTKTVSVTVLRTTDNVVVYTDVAMTNDNTVRVTFASSVTLADYTVTVIG